MNRVPLWLAEAGLEQYIDAFRDVGEEEFSQLLMQDYANYGVTDIASKQLLFRCIKKVSSELSGTPVAQATRSGTASQRADGTLRPVRQVGGSDLLDLDDSLQLSEHAALDISVSPRNILGPLSAIKPRQQPQAMAQQMQQQLDGPDAIPPAKIRVVVRKRPLNAKESEREDEDVINVFMNEASLVVNEPKVKVDLTKYTERHVFSFDATLDENVSNDQVYRSTVKPLVSTIFRGGKATCFAYGQTGSGKTYTMRPLPVRAAQDILGALALGGDPDVRLFVSCFEIYGGKLFDLLNSRKRLDMREDGKKNVCIVGLEEFQVDSIDQINEMIESSAQHRSTGSTGANADSSRSHSIMQFVLKRDMGKRQAPRNLGKISFIDLAGSERGADTYDNDKQTRLEGAEINKSLLALKECIRALDTEARHIPFRGSKLTEVLRDSFVGSEARTVMIANISPCSSSCEHTLNTLRYADRVKELRKGGGGSAAIRSTSSGSAGDMVSLVSRTSSDAAMLAGGAAAMAGSPYAKRRALLQPSGQPQGLNLRNAWGGHAAAVMEDTRGGMEALHLEQQHQQQQASGLPRYSSSVSAYTAAAAAGMAGAGLGAIQGVELSLEEPMLDMEFTLDSILEAEDDLIMVHRKHIEDSMAQVRTEMGLLGEVDQPGSAIETYVLRLEALLAEKQESLNQVHRKLRSFKRLLQAKQANGM